jgi:hypothetical protein
VPGVVVTRGRARVEVEVVVVKVEVVRREERVERRNRSTFILET